MGNLRHDLSNYQHGHTACFVADTKFIMNIDNRMICVLWWTCSLIVIAMIKYIPIQTKMPYFDRICVRIPLRGIPHTITLKDTLTHWGRDKMAAISQTMFSNAFSWMKMCECCLSFHWSLFLRVQLTIFHHWFRSAPSHYLNQWWLVYWRIYALVGLNELITCVINTLRLGDTYLHLWTGSSVQAIACCLCSNKPLPQPTMTYCCQLDP